MSGGTLFQHALRRVVRSRLPPEAERDLVAVLDSCRSGSLQLFYEAALEAGLGEADLAPRGAAVTFCYSAGQLADDLADGECGYLEAPRRTGPAAQFMLQNLCFAALAEADLPALLLRELAADLVRGAGAQQVEVRTRAWTFPLSRQVGEGISGLQFSVYFRTLWWGTPLEHVAAQAGADLGFAAHVASDVKSGDPRFAGLDRPDRCALLVLSREALDRLRVLDLRCLRAPIADIEATLEAVG